MFAESGFQLRLAIFNNDPEGKIFGAELCGQEWFLLFNGCRNQLAGDLFNRKVAGFPCFTEFMNKAINIRLS